MDGESSYESDISESWSLIDINLNEESNVVVEAHSLLQPDKTPVQSKALKKEENLGLKDFSNKSTDGNQTVNGKPNDSDSDSSFQIENFIGCVKEDLDEESRKRESDEGSKNDSCDAESIEILDVDGNDRDTDVDRLDISFIHENDFDKTYNSDDEESFYQENIDTENKKTCLAVMKRKRRKFSRHSNSSTDSVNRDCMSSNEKYSNEHPSEGIKNNDESRVQSYELIGRPVYKHYRNNVTNTVLSLSMGVIFAGVACIAIGHFLGVHDSGETAVELMETLKKLQMENIVLQSRLNHLNRAFITRDMSSKLEHSTSESYDKSFCDRRPELGATKTEETKPNPAALPPASFEKTRKLPLNWNSMEWLSQLQNLVQFQSNRLYNENGVDIKKIVRNIHDQLILINRKKKEDARLKHLEDSDAKISKILQQIIGKLSLSQDNIEKLYQKLVKLKNKLNKKLSKILVEDNFESFEENFHKTEKRKPVTERDLLSIQWNPRRKETNYNDNSFRDSVLVYKFPQPEEHYILKKEALENLTETIVNPAVNDNPVSLSSEEVSIKDEPTQTSKIPEEFSVFERKENKELESSGKKCKSERNKHKDKKREWKKSENNLKKEKFKGEKKHKRTLIKLQDDDKEPGKNNRKRDKGSDLKDTKSKYSLKKTKQAFNETKYHKKKHLKMEKLVQKVFKQKSIKKKNKKPKSKRVFLSSMFGKSPRESQLKNYCSAAEEYDGRCLNFTGGWMFRWAGGREESRRHESLGDWQFERAKGRKELRGEDLNVNWQFRRASARESTRNDDRWLYEKYRNHNQKGFFHEGYSWI